HGQIGSAIEQSRFQLLDEQPLATDLGQGAIKNAVALGGHFEQLDLTLGVVGNQQIANMISLPEGQTAGTGGNDKTGRLRHDVRLAGQIFEDDGSNNANGAQNG